jgi:hypothetical protein
MVFGWLELPPIWFKNRELSDQLFSLHRWIGVAIAALVIAHASPLHEDGLPPAQFVTLGLNVRVGQSLILSVG